MKQRTVKGDSREFIIWFFEVLNLLLIDKLTEREIEVLAEFLKLREDKYKYNPFHTAAKNKVISDFKERGETMSRQSIHNHTAALKKKGIIFTEEDGMLRLNPQIREALEKGFTDGKFGLTFIFDIHDND